MKQITVKQPENLILLRFEYNVNPDVSVGRLFISSPVGEFRSRSISLEGAPNKELVSKMLTSLFEFDDKVGKSVVGEEFWEELKRKLLEEYNALDI